MENQKRKSYCYSVIQLKSYCYYFDHAMEIIDIRFRDILLDEKKYRNILIYGISYKFHKLSYKFDGLSTFSC